MATQVEEKFTCQVCGRQIKASSGLIAHHGYKRPFEGWQTNSCEGARYVPYEESCERLREVANMTKVFIERQEMELKDFLTNTPETITVLERRSSYERHKEVAYTKPENFNKNNYYASIPRTYACAYEDKKHQYERTIKAAKSDLAVMQRRITEWKVTA